jgi:hypothetical protein
MKRKTEDKYALPLMGDNNIPVFDSRNKTEIFFGRKHLFISLSGTSSSCVLVIMSENDWYISSIV